MATIRTALQLYDGITGPARGMVKVLHSVVGAFESMQNVSDRAIDTSAVQRARDDLARLEATVEQTENGIRQAAEEQERLNQKLNRGAGAANGLWNKVKGIAATIGGMVGLQKVVGLSDQMAGAKARLELIVDDGGSVEALQQKIMASAQASRASYLDTMQSVSKLGLLAGKAFSNNDEMIKFAELMNKNFIIAGASAQEQSSAMYQLNQALGSGRLQGDEYRSIIENAPLLAQAIEDYMRGIGMEGTMKEWSSDGLLTADVIKNALFSSADEVEARFSQMPLTWAQVWTSMKNRALMIFQPILEKINTLANSERIQGAVDGLLNAFGMVATVLGFILGLATSVGGAIYDNWSWLEPLVWGVVAALGAYYGVMLAVNTVQAIQNGLDAWGAFQKKVHAASTMMAAGATFTQTVAQHGLNAALYACPLTWIIILIIALVALFYAAVAAVNKFAGTSYSATGAICGAFMAALAFIGNIFIALWNLVVDVFVLIYNLVATVANFIGNVFTDPIGAVARLFFDLADTVLGVLQALAGAIDAIFGSNLAGSVQGWRDDLGGWVDDTFGKGTEVMAKLNADDMKLGRFEYGAAFDLGYNFGEGIEDKVSGLFDFNDLGASDAAEQFDYANAMTDLGDIADNTGKMSDDFEYAEEDLQYLRDIAEREAINRFTTAEINIEQHNENHIASGMDVDGIMDAWTEDFAERMDVSGEGVHE